MTLSPIKRHREKKAYKRQQAIEASSDRFRQYCYAVMSEASKNGMLNS